MMEQKGREEGEATIRNGLMWLILARVVFSMIIIRFHINIYIVQMQKRQEKTSPIDSLTKMSFVCFGLGAVLTSISEAFWINFSAYFFLNELGPTGILIFLIAQIVEAFGVIIAWILVSKLKVPFGNHMAIYIVGTIIVMFSQPLIFIPSLNNYALCLTFAILYKLGASLTLYSQLTMISLVTNSRSRRKKLVAKITQFGLGGTFILIFIMTAVSIYVPFIWKYFLAVCIYVILGGICSIFFVYKIRQNHLSTYDVIEQPASSEINWFKQPRFYAYGITNILTTLYTSIITSVYPYLIRSLNHINQIRYLTAIGVLYFSAFLAAFLARKSFMYTGNRPMVSLGMLCAFVSMVFYVFAFKQAKYQSLIYVGTSIVGISQVIMTNCTLNLINDMIGIKMKSRQCVYALYMFSEKIITGIVIYVLISCALDNSIEILNFSWVYLPFILYFVAWVIIMTERTLLGEKPYAIDQKRVKLKLQTMKDIIVN